MPSIVYHIYRNGKLIDTVYTWFEAREWREKEGIIIKEERL